MTFFLKVGTDVKDLLTSLSHLTLWLYFIFRCIFWKQVLYSVYLNDLNLILNFILNFNQIQTKCNTFWL